MCYQQFNPSSNPKWSMVPKIESSFNKRMSLANPHLQAPATLSPTCSPTSLPLPVPFASLPLLEYESYVVVVVVVFQIQCYHNNCHWQQKRLLYQGQCSTTGVSNGVVCAILCGMMDIKEPLLLIGKRSLCGSSGISSLAI